MEEVAGTEAQGPCGDLGRLLNTNRRLDGDQPGRQGGSVLWSLKATVQVCFLP